MTGEGNVQIVTALGGVDRLPWSGMTTGAVSVSGFVFAHEGTNTIVRGVLPADGPESEDGDFGAGTLIRTLERWIIHLLGVAGQWESVALCVAAKSIARFEELKERGVTEYFHVGNLASALVAMVLVVPVSVLV